MTNLTLGELMRGVKVTIRPSAAEYAPFYMVGLRGYVTKANFTKQLVAVHVPYIAEMWFKAADVQVIYES